MDPYDSPLRVPYSSAYNPCPHSLRRTGQFRVRGGVLLVYRLGVEGSAGGRSSFQVARQHRAPAWTGVLCQAMCDNCDPRVVCDFWRRDGLSLARWPIVLLCCVLFKFPKGPCAQTLYTLAPSTNTGIALRRKYILFGRMDHADTKPQTPKLLKPSTLNIFGAASSTPRCSEDRASLVLVVVIKGSGCAATSPYSP